MRRAIFAVALILSVPVFWIGAVYAQRHRVCVVLENGLTLGYEALFDLGRRRFRPLVVPKFPDGTPLIRNETWEIFVTTTTLYGLALGDLRADDYRFAWRADTGLVRRHNDRALHDKLVEEAGPANWDIDIDSVSTGWLLTELLRRQGTPRQSCQTQLVTW